MLILPFLVCVIVYTALVGFEIPAMRTLLTVVLLSIAVLVNQKIHALKLLLLSASLLLWFDPFSILSAAFWLSYGACFILIRVYQTIQQKPQDDQVNKEVTPKAKIWMWSKVLFESQWKVFLALFPLVVLIFQQVSWERVKRILFYSNIGNVYTHFRYAWYRLQVDERFKPFRPTYWCGNTCIKRYGV